nr:MAG TPA: hypothetical protein [Caudoviricetes sp.]
MKPEFVYEQAKSSDVTSMRILLRIICIPSTYSPCETRVRLRTSEKQRCYQHAYFTKNNLYSFNIQSFIRQFVIG